MHLFLNKSSKLFKLPSLTIDDYNHEFPIFLNFNNRFKLNNDTTVIVKVKKQNLSYLSFQSYHLEIFV